MSSGLIALLAPLVAAGEPIGPHHEHLMDPPAVPTRSAVRPPSPPTPGPDVWVYGYWPYWAGGVSDLDWDRLTHVAIFNVDMNSDGSVSSTSYWTSNAAEAMALAEPYGVKVHLTLTCFDDNVMAAVLPSASRRATLVETLGELVDDYGAHGVSVDCEGMDSDLRDDLTDFVRELDARVDEVTVALPAVDWSSAYDYAELSKHSYLFIMGYGYHWSGSDPGPVAPLYAGDLWSDWTLSWSVEDYLSKGVPKDRLIMGMPLYGRDWPSTSTDVPGTATGTSSSITMVSAVAEVDAYGRNYDTVSETVYYFPDSRSQVWYDDTESVQKKVRYAVDEGLLGVGFWALNYEGGDPDFWAMMDDETTSPDDGGTDGGTDGGGDGGDGGTDGGGVDTDATPSDALTAYAGDDVLAYPGELVYLAGQGEGAANLQYRWSQSAGPPVQFSDASSQLPSFTAPAESGNLQFELVVFNAGDESAPDMVTVAVARSDIGSSFAPDKGCGVPTPMSAAWLLGLFGAVLRRRQ